MCSGFPGLVDVNSSHVLAASSLLRHFANWLMRWHAGRQQLPPARLLGLERDADTAKGEALNLPSLDPPTNRNENLLLPFFGGTQDLTEGSWRVLLSPKPEPAFCQP